MKQNFEMPYTESGITLNFPDNNFFCFENCAGYQQFSGNHFKEMDAGWFDTTENKIFLIELKDFTEATIVGEYAEKRVWDMIKKSIDSCLMLQSILVGTQPSTDIQSCLPQLFTRDFKISVFHIIHTNEEQKADIQFLSDSFKAKFIAYKALFGVEHANVISYDQAKRFLNWVI